MKVSVKRVEFGSVRALVSVTIDGIELRGFRVIDKNEGDGPWVHPPTRVIDTAKGKQFFSVVFIEDADKRAAFNQEILDAYTKQCEEETKAL